MTWRNIIGVLLVGGFGTCGSVAGNEGKIQTIAGPVFPHELGTTLSHEHVLVDFIGAEFSSPDRYGQEIVVEIMRPFIDKVKAKGVQTMIECTPAFLGRDPRVLEQLSARTGMQFVTNTGLYGSASDKFLPPYAWTDTAQQLADRWIAEFRDGIDGTEVRPGFIKSAVDRAPELSPVDAKLIHAAALTHLATGLTIAVHTGSGPGLAQLDILAEHGVHGSAWIWVHAQGQRDDGLLIAAERGAWISLDGVVERAMDRHVDLCVKLRNAGFLDQILLSHDSGWYDPSKFRGGAIRGYTLIFDEMIPRLLARGFSQEEVDQLLITNPARALTIGVRRLP